jgi:hypothetical protein
MSSTPALPSVRGHFVLLKTNQLQLLLPQADVGAASYLAQMPRPVDEHPGMFGISNEAGDVASFVAALSPQMSLETPFPQGQFLMTALTAQDGISLCWKEVKVLIDTELQPEALPAVMLPPGAAVTSYVELGGELAFCCTGRALVAHAFA